MNTNNKFIEPTYKLIMEPIGSTGGHFEFQAEDSTGGTKKSTHLELQELYGGDKVSV